MQLYGCKYRSIFYLRNLLVAFNQKRIIYLHSIDTRKSFHAFLNIALLIIAGEAIFLLPFVLIRIFRPVYLHAFDLTNFEIGVCFSVYGIVGMLSYFLGGVLADKFSAAKLMGTALILTALGGFYMATFPSYTMMKVLFGFWGFSTIFLFWAALIKATRQWGGDRSQGRAFGILDGGRGLFAAGIGVLGLFIFSKVMGSEVTEIGNNTEALRQIIITTSSTIVAIGVLVFFFFKVDDNAESNEHSLFSNYRACLNIPSVYLLMIIILCAYVGYKITGLFPQFATEVMNFSDAQAAKLGTFLLFLRAFGAVLFGFLADRFKVGIWLIVSFVLILSGSLLMSSGVIQSHLTVLFLITVLLSGIGIYGARALYFAAMKAGNIPLALTGTAVGLMSVVGYTPDIFVGPMTGYYLDTYPGEAGHHIVFGILAGFSLLGLICSFFYQKIAAQG